VFKIHGGRKFYSKEFSFATTNERIVPGRSRNEAQVIILMKQVEIFAFVYSHPVIGGISS
jgi:hypothetical protein